MYDHKAWCKDYDRREIPAEWYLHYEVQEDSEMSPVNPISKSILLFQCIFGRVPDSMEEIMRCYDSSNEMHDEGNIECMDKRISKLGHQEYMKIPQDIWQ